jgi:hypothetical protein
MFYRNIAFLLIAGAVSSMLVSKITAHSGLTFTSPSRTVYVPFNLVLSWLSLTVCSLVGSALMLRELYRFFHAH